MHLAEQVRRKDAHPRGEGLVFFRLAWCIRCVYRVSNTPILPLLTQIPLKHVTQFVHARTHEEAILLSLLFHGSTACRDSYHFHSTNTCSNCIVPTHGDLRTGLCDILCAQFSVTATGKQPCAIDACSSVSLRISFHSCFFSNNDIVPNHGDWRAYEMVNPYSPESQTTHTE